MCRARKSVKKMKAKKGKSVTCSIFFLKAAQGDPTKKIMDARLGVGGSPPQKEKLFGSKLKLFFLH